MATRKNVLVVGVTQPSVTAPQHIKQDGGAPEDLREKIKSMMEEAQKAGFDLEVKQIDPEALGTRKQEIVQLLKERSWDGFIVGFGVRGDPSLTIDFEDLVNAARTLRPEARMGFNTTPLDLAGTVQRMFASDQA